MSGEGHLPVPVLIVIRLPSSGLTGLWASRRLPKGQATLNTGAWPLR